MMFVCSKETGHHVNQTGVESGTSTFMPLNTRSDTDNDTEQWLASLAKRAAAREDATAAGVDVTESLTRLSELTKQNIQALEETFSPGTRPLRLDDEVSSVYSLDQDGFYTSFHNDSGLRRSTGTLLDNDGDLTPVKETQGMGSNNTIDSVIFCPMGVTTPGKVDLATSSSGKLRPAPPVRSGSRLSSNSSLADAEEKLKSVSDAFTTDSASNSAADFATSKDGVLPGESSQSESDQETIYARLKAKTKISSRSIPSWCLISDEDSTDSSSMCLAGAGPQDIASISFSGSMSAAGATPQIPPLSDSTVIGSDAKGEELSGALWNCSTLPLRYLESKVWEEDLTDQSNSWPRSRRSQQQPVAGILKRDKSPAGSLKPKTLNFAPVVNMFDHHTSQGIELPLNAASSTSSSSSIDCSSDASTAGLAYKLSMPLSARSNPRSKSQVDMKYQPCITVKPGKNGENLNKISQNTYTRPLIKATSTHAPQAYAVPQVKGTTEMSESSDKSVSSSESSLPSLSDCGQGGYLNMSASLGHRSLDTLSSSSSAGLSDIDSSLTYVSMSSSNSTPTNSTLALCPDDLPTPVNSPTLEHDTYRISSVTLAGAQNKDSSSDNAITPENGPILQAPTVPSQPSPAEVSDGSRLLGSGDKRSLGSFASDASTEAAPSSWVGERLNSQSLSADSGFSSPTTPTTSTSDHHHHHVLHHGMLQPGSRANNSQVHEAQVHSEDVLHSGNISSLGRKVRTSDPPSQLSLGQKHELFKVSHSVGSSSSKQTTPRSDSYRAATKDLDQFNRQSRKSMDGSVRPKTRSQSSAQMPSSSAPSSQPRMPKSMSCPTGMVADLDAVARADSYRFAVRNTQGVVGEVATRNTSYRMARGDDDPLPDARMDAINSWEAKPVSGSRDFRRMGITDIDQLKCYDSDSSSGRTSSSSLNGNSSRSFAGINSSRKKMKPEVQNLLRGDKTPSPEVKRMSKISSKSGKDKDKLKRQSSTYIRFDPIFEHGDDVYSSTDTLRAESIEMITSEEGFLMSDKIVGQLPPGRVRVGGGRKSVDDKAVMSILDSIKTTIKSMSGKNTADKDMWRYEGGL